MLRLKAHRDRPSIEPGPAWRLAPGSSPFVFVRFHTGFCAAWRGFGVYGWVREPCSGFGIPTESKFQRQESCSQSMGVEL